jgi:hypothetical protein
MEESQCFSCRHYQAGYTEGHACSAFPKGIPRAVLRNKIMHDRPIVGQVGKDIYEPNRKTLERERRRAA